MHSARNTTATAAVHPRAGGEHRRRPRFRRPLDRPVHPRAGGEHIRFFHVTEMFGSSPRGRGTHSPAALAPQAVHPRAGGEHTVSPRPNIALSAGSSPRGRGTHARRRAVASRATVHPRAGGEHVARAVAGRFNEVAVVQRFIPARAGNTLCHAHRFIPARAGNTGQVAGSSPRGRGTRFTRQRGGPAPIRFIPARAGNTSCGLSVRPDSGSSPRGRGTQPMGRSPRRPIIPVHPRAGGEHNAPPSVRFIPARAGNTGCTGFPPVSVGSSPRGRGHTRRILACPNRFIPARAGNTASIGSCAPRTVHPRAGGEHVRPRAPDVQRFIPARAGNTRPRAEVRFIPARAGNTAAPVRGDGFPARAGIVARFIPARAGNTLVSVHPHRFIPARAGNTCLPSVIGHPIPVHPRAGGEHGTVAFLRPVHPRAGMPGRTGSSPRGRGTLFSQPSDSANLF